MRHRKNTLKLNRTTGHRKALLRNLTASLIAHERIRTTEAKAKALRPYVERLVTLARKGTLHQRRQAFAAIGKKHAVHKLFEELGPRFQERPGGYTRIIRDGQRAGDGSWMAFIEFVDYKAPEKKARKAAETAEAAPAEAQG
ncbi:MAG: 50S ribosomal protein L17 [Candidatus Sumerlaeia bacterium]|jgi:large subunit ribosomal protein L17|nr:50S ribosomal protein L17 [Candidatus Sumerlaeia bacterium]